MRRTATAFVLTVLALTGCRTERGNGVAAVVEGTEVSRDDYEELMQAVVANPEVFGIEEDLDTGTIAADAARSLLSDLVLTTASSEYLAQRQQPVTDADRQAQLDAIAQQTDIDAVPPSVLDLVVGLRAGATARGRIAASSGEAAAAWDASPADLGLVCVRHILVETEAEAQEVLTELEAGADFAELAAERSIEPAAATTGGAIELQPGQPCIQQGEAETSLDPVFVAAARDAVPGTPVGPVETSFGWHVIIARPYDEVAPAVDAVIGERQFGEYLETVDVEVDPRYGRWDRDLGAVVALDEAAPSTTAAS